VVEFPIHEDDVGYSDLQPEHPQKEPPEREDPPALTTATSKAESARNSGIAVLAKLRKKHAETSKRKASKALKDKEMLQNLSVEDLRKSTRALDLLAGLDEFQTDLFDKTEPETKSAP
jgi:hypothetical protein